MFSSLRRIEWIRRAPIRTNDPPTMIVIVLLCVPLLCVFFIIWKVHPILPPLNYFSIRTIVILKNECIFWMYWVRDWASLIFMSWDKTTIATLWRKAAKIKIENGLSEKVIFLFPHIRRMIHTGWNTINFSDVTFHVIYFVYLFNGEDVLQNSNAFMIELLAIVRLSFSLNLTTI